LVLVWNEGGCGGRSSDVEQVHPVDEDHVRGSQLVPTLDSQAQEATEQGKERLINITHWQPYICS